MITDYPLFEPTQQQKSSQAQRVLDLLKICDRSTLDLLDVGPRPAAYVRQLRQMGYQIESAKEGNIAVYHLIGKVEMVEVTPAMQELYYTTPHWQYTRAKRKEFDGYRCACCQTTERLQVHHWKYDLFNEQQCDLLTVCDECHNRIHSYANVHCHFPRWVTPEIAEKLSLTARAAS